MIKAISKVVKCSDDIVGINRKINSDVMIVRLNGEGEEIEAVDWASESVVVEVTTDVGHCGFEKDAVSRRVSTAAVISVGGETNLCGGWSLFCKQDNKN